MAESCHNNDIQFIPQIDKCRIAGGYFQGGGVFHSPLLLMLGVVGDQILYRYMIASVRSSTTPSESYSGFSTWIHRIANEQALRIDVVYLSCALSFILICLKVPYAVMHFTKEGGGSAMLTRRNSFLCGCSRFSITVNGGQRFTRSRELTQPSISQLIQLTPTGHNTNINRLARAVCSRDLPVRAIAKKAASKAKGFASHRASHHNPPNLKLKL